MNFDNTQWLIEGEYRLMEDGIGLRSLTESDYFVNPLNGKVKSDAVFRYREVEGDFIFKARVSCYFDQDFDAPILMAYDNEKLWTKVCFEQTDQGTPAIVSVVTRDRSDDAIGEYINREEVWLLLARQGDTFSAHYSQDGDKYFMVRLAWLPMPKKIKVGFGVQSPTGGGVRAYFRNMSLKERTPSDIRDANKD